MNTLQKIIFFLCNKEIYVPIVTIILALIVNKIIKKAISKIMVSGKTNYDIKKRKTIIELVSNFAKYFVFVIAAIIILQTYGIDTASIIAGLGVASAVIGLAFQDTLKDFISGVTIILENYYIVGDIIKYKDFTGEVSSLGLKSTKIKNANGEILTLANRNVSEIINLSQTKATILMTIPIAYEEPISKVEKALSKALEEIIKLPNIDIKNTSYLGVDALADSSVNYLIKISCVQEKKWEVKRASLKIIKNILDQEKIKIPYPQIEVHNG